MFTPYPQLEPCPRDNQFVLLCRRALENKQDVHIVIWRSWRQVLHMRDQEMAKVGPVRNVINYTETGFNRKLENVNNRRNRVLCKSFERGSTAWGTRSNSIAAGVESITFWRIPITVSGTLSTSCFWTTSEPQVVTAAPVLQVLHMELQLRQMYNLLSQILF